MGNGYTFAVETIVFLPLIVGTYRVLRIPTVFPGRGRLGNIGIYGDDIIVVPGAVSLLNDVLQVCGFVVNHDKSYIEGPFRESCGGDYLYGTNVRGVYAETLKSPQDRVSLVNRLIQWGAPFAFAFPRASQILLKGDPEIIVPPWDSDDSGLKVPLLLAQRTGILRSAGPTLGKLLGCHEATSVYRRYAVSSPKLLLLNKYGVPCGPITMNGEAAMVSILQGTLRGTWQILHEPINFGEYVYTREGCSVTLRSYETRYKLSLAAAPGWDATENGSAWFSNLMSFRRWEANALVSLNWIMDKHL